MSRFKISNVELAKAVCEAIPEFSFEYVLDVIDIARTPRQEKLFCKKCIIEDTIDSFKCELEAKQEAEEQKRNSFITE